MSLDQRRLERVILGEMPRVMGIETLFFTRNLNDWEVKDVERIFS